MNRKQKGLLITMERKQTLMGEWSHGEQSSREKLLQEVEDMILREELELFEKREEMKELMKERRRTKARRHPAPKL